jgi:hypothetical protein
MQLIMLLGNTYYELESYPLGGKKQLAAWRIPKNPSSRQKSWQRAGQSNELKDLLLITISLKYLNRFSEPQGMHDFALTEKFKAVLDIDVIGIID